MAQRTPVVLEDDRHKPLAAGDTVPGTAIQVSRDSGNALQVGSDEGLFVAHTGTEPVQRFRFSRSEAVTGGAWPETREYLFSETVTFTGLPPGGQIVLALGTSARNLGNAESGGRSTFWAQSRQVLGVEAAQLANMQSLARAPGEPIAMGSSISDTATFIYHVQLKPGITQLTLTPGISLHEVSGSGVDLVEIDAFLLTLVITA